MNLTAPPLEAYNRTMAEASEAYDIATGTAFVAICKKYGTENARRVKKRRREKE